MEPSRNDRRRGKGSEGPGEKKETEQTYAEPVTPTALKRFEVFDHIPKQQVHIIPTMGHRFSELLLLSHPRLPFLFQEIPDENLRNLPEATGRPSRMYDPSVLIASFCRCLLTTGQGELWRRHPKSRAACPRNDTNRQCKSEKHDPAACFLCPQPNDWFYSPDSVKWTDFFFFPNR